MAYAVLVRIDPAGEYPVLASDGDDFSTIDGARWRFVAETDDYEHALRLLESARAEQIRRQPAPL